MRSNNVHKSINVTKTIGGGDKSLVILNGTLGAMVCFALQNAYFLPVTIFMHIFIRWMTRRDPWLRRIYINYNRHNHYYDPWVSTKRMKRFLRPHGFGRDLLC